MKYDPKETANPIIVTPTPDNPRNFSITLDTPISPRENFRRMYKGQAEWIPTGMDTGWFCPRIIPDNIARAFVIESQKYTGPVGGKDMFGIEWEYVPSAHGSINRPGNPTLKDITQWKEVIHFPDVDSWDWEGSAKENREYLKNAVKYQNVCIFTSYFERLISFMDFGPAAYAIQNKKSQVYVNEIFERLTDLWIDIVDHCAKYFGHDFDGFCFHDDWGAQHSPFFNARVVRQMIVPHMKRLTDHIHSLGYNADLHSCGKLLGLITCIEEAGWDSWEGMVINDYSDAYANRSTKLIMKAVYDEGKMNAATDDEIKALATRYVEEFGHRDHPVINGYRWPTKPEFYIEVYKQSREKFGA